MVPSNPKSPLSPPPAVSQMQEKGAQQSLLLYEDLALITSIHSRTVITALKASDFKTVTNIDSAMVVEKG